MPTVTQAKASIHKRFITQWGTRTPYTFEGEPFDPTDKEQVPEGSAWTRLAVRHSAANQDTMGQAGNRKFRRFGFVVVEIFVPKDTGTLSLDQYTDAVKDCFEAIRFEGIVFEAMDHRERGVSGPWLSVVAEIRFSYEEVK